VGLLRERVRTLSAGPLCEWCRTLSAGLLRERFRTSLAGLLRKWLPGVSRTFQVPPAAAPCSR